ncbi:agmatine deiminase family protein [Roseivirga spongicola]|uniref:Agmatine deiminase n=1 Tax=Roseivirga spongicola TaxID=333140 RepID=A0A150X571_9BACT|nr:agmatine deiminase family protein [Roseivirga spongicola]KYG73850.1 hypothetical protein AWW68_14355 [Roseivirga spongicola]PWL32006.1 MAG: hypothetical protein DCO95_02155 [Roseivirga sp. XM-24bin3]
MIADWQTNKIHFSEKLKIKLSKTCIQIEKELESLGQKPNFLPNTNDIWARDFMPIQISDNRFLEYRYDPDYLQGSSEEQETREIKSYPDIICNEINLPTIKSDLIIDGGNIVKSENTVILTDKIVWENRRHYSEKELVKKIHESFEVDNVILIPWDEDCEFGHSDGMLRFINNDTVLISGFYEQADSKFKKELIKPLEEAKLNCEWLRCSKNETESNIAYINFLQTTDMILVPSLKQKEDENAFEKISDCFPNYAQNKRIRKIDMREIVRQGGALNCISWTIKK